MDNLNKLISFGLGLIVVIVFLAVVTGKINLGKKISLQKEGGSAFSLPSIIGSSSPTSTQTPTISKTLEKKPTVTVSKNITFHSYQQTQKETINSPSKIPATGSPTVLFPILLTALSGGIFLRKFNR